VKVSWEKQLQHSVGKCSQ